MTVGSLLWTGALLAVVSATIYALARVAQRLDEAERHRSMRQWQLMCEELGAENLDDAYEPRRVMREVVGHSVD